MRLTNLAAALALATTFAALAAGCVIKDGDDDSSGASDGDGTGAPDAPPSTVTSVAPAGGTWFYAQVTQTTTTCGSAIGTTPAGDFTINGVASSAFHVIASDGAFDCTYSAEGFDCPNRALATQDLHPQYDAVITGHATASGTFDLATHGSGSQVGTFTCAGSDCAALAAATGAHVPCTASVTFQIAKR